MIMFSKGAQTPRTQSDTLTSNDTVEVLLGISEGPIKGLADGPKTFKADDTALVNQNGEANFQNFLLDVWPGSPLGHTVKMYLGGISSPINISQTLAQNVPVVRTGTLRNIDCFDFRIAIQQLVLNNSKGVFPAELSLKFEIKKTTDATWSPAWVVEASNDFSSIPASNGSEETYRYNGPGIDPTTFDLDTFTYTYTSGTPAAPAVPTAEAWAGNPNTGAILSWNSSTSAWVSQGTAPANGYLTSGAKRIYGASATPPTGARTGDIWLKAVGEMLVWNGSAWVPGQEFNQPASTAQDGIWTIKEKVSSTTAKDLRVFVPASSTAEYQFRVTKLSPDSGTQLTSVVVWESVQQIDRRPYTFTNVAMARVLGQASDQFTGLPTWNGEWEGRIVKVPSNYNEVTRVYTGIWDGTFKLAYTNNTAWVLMDFIENDSYGLSRVYPHICNKWKFYEFGQYCDTLVTNPDSSQSPRWTFNDYISEPRDAKELAQYIAGSAGARYVEDGNGLVDLIIDKDNPAVALFTQENVSEEGFNYSYTDRLTRANQIVVEFANPDLNWENDHRIIQDDADIATYGAIQDNFVAVGCTSVNEAIRRARRRLITGLTEKEIVTFTTNRQGKFLTEWDTILVADPDMGTGISGRVKSVVNSTTITLRDAVSLEAGVTYWASFTVPDTTLAKPFKVERRQITTGAGSTTTLTFATALPTLPEYAVFTIEAPSLIGYPKPYRITNIEDASGTGEVIQITAIELNRNKFSYIDTGVDQGEISYSLFGKESPRSPTNLKVAPEVRPKGLSSVLALILTFTRSESKWVRMYKIDHAFNGATISSYEVRDPRLEIEDPADGYHTFTIVAVDIKGRQSPPVTINYNVQGTSRPVNPPRNLRLVGGLTTTTFGVTNPSFEWDAPDYSPDFAGYVLQVKNGATVLRTVALAAAPQWTYEFLDNKADNGGTPRRSYTVEVSAIDASGNTSAPVSLTVTNATPATPTVSLSSTAQGLVVTVSRCPDLDYAGTKIWVSTTNGFSISAVAPIFDGPQTSFTFQATPGTTYYVRAAHYDNYDATPANLNAAAQISFTQPTVTAYDVLYVDGVPSSDVIDELNTNTDNIFTTSQATIETALDVFDLRNYVDGLAYLSGVPLGTLITNETNTRISENAVTASSLALLGAKSGDGLSWIMNVGAVMVTPTESIGTRFDSITSTMGANTAAVTVVSNAVTDINDRLYASWGVLLDINGRVSGIKLHSAGAGGTSVSYFDVNADVFRVFNGTSNIPAFSVSGGNVYISGNLVQSSSVQQGALKRITSDQSIGSVAMISGGNPGGHVLVKSMNFNVDDATSKFTVTISMLYESTNSNVITMWLKIGQSAPVWATSGNANMTNADKVFKVSAYNGPVTIVYSFTGLPVGTNTLEIHAGSIGSGTHNVNFCVDPYFSIQEDKRTL